MSKAPHILHISMTSRPGPTSGGGPLDMVANATAGLKPLILSVTPANHATEVDEDAHVLIEFSKAIEPESLSAVLTGEATPPVLISRWANGWNAPYFTLANLSHVADFSSELTYTLTIAATDYTGQTVTSITDFTTGDFIAPTIISTVPAASATLVANLVSIVITFSEPMAPADCTFTIAPNIKDAVVWSVGDTVATVSTTAAVAGTIYAVTVTGKDTCGVVLVPVVFRFTTAPAPDVTTVAPLNAAVGCTIRQPVVITFNQAMAPGSTTIDIPALTGTGVWS